MAEIRGGGARSFALRRRADDKCAKKAGTRAADGESAGAAIDPAFFFFSSSCSVRVRSEPHSRRELRDERASASIFSSVE